MHTLRFKLLPVALAPFAFLLYTSARALAPDMSLALTAIAR